MTSCPICNHQVPPGEWCGACGAHLPTSSAQRLRAYAAAPAQHVLHPSIVTTIFPHLSRRGGTHFRLGLLAVAVLLIALGILRLAGPAIAIAAAAVPLLYVLYLYDFVVHKEEPFLAISLTFGLGLLLGLPWGIITGPIVTATTLRDMATGITLPNALIAGVLLPLGAQVLMLVGALVLMLVGRHHEPLDGFAFGAASALGFTFAVTLVNLAPELHRGLVDGTPPVTNALMVLGRGLLLPYLNAATTGLIAAALWLRRVPTRRFGLAWTISLPAVIAVAIVVRIILGIADIAVPRVGVVVVIYLIVAAALLLFVRLAIHSLLLSREADPTIGSTRPCSRCHRVVPRMAFCPDCGSAVEASPEAGPSHAGSGAAPVAAEPAPAFSGSYRPANREEIEGLTKALHPVRNWGSLVGALLAGAVALGIVAVLVTPSRKPACGVTCTPPPPPCVGFCSHASAAPPLRTDHSYTSSAYGYSVDYTQFDPSQTDSSSIGWNLSNDVGQYSVEVTAGDASHKGAEGIVNSLVTNNFPDYTEVYTIPGSEVGYVPGAGAVYDDEVTPFFGSASDTRLVVMAAVRNNLAIAVVGDGDAATDSSGHVDPSELPVSPFVDSLANATRWPGESPR